MEEALTGKVSQWIKEKKTIQFIKQSFGKFLRHFKDEQGQDVYETWISEMCQSNKTSFEVTYGHISLKMPTLAIWIAEHPSGVIPILNSVAYELTLEIYPLYEQMSKDVYVWIWDLPIEDNLRDLR